MTNAVLTAVEAPGALDAYAVAADAGEVKWNGHQAGYLTRGKKSVKRGDLRETVEFDVLILQGIPPVEINPGEQAKGDTLIIEDRRMGVVAKRFRVVAIDVRAVGSSVDSTRLELDDERLV